MAERTGDPNAHQAASRARAESPDSGRTGCPGSCEIWGILNVTPDSFSDGGKFIAVEAAVTQGMRLMRDGAHVIDVGGESSRPSGKTYGQVSEVSEQEELGRVMPVIDALVRYGARVSIDTVKAKVAERALRAGASLLNDVSCGRSEALMRVAAESGAELCLMHNRGRGERTEQNTRYGEGPREWARTVRDELMAAVDRAVSAGVDPARIWIDPGIGFAKRPEQSASLLAQTDLLVASGHRVLIGASRKSFIAELAPLGTGNAPSPSERLGGSAAALAIAVWLGAHAVRVHDVVEMRQAAELTLRMREVRP